MQTQTCMGLHPRVKYVGNYTSHECDIEVSNVTSEDSGRWSCDVKSFRIGAHTTRVYRRFEQRGSKVRTGSDLELMVKSPTTTSSKFVLNKLKFVNI